MTYQSGKRLRLQLDHPCLRETMWAGYKKNIETRRSNEKDVNQSCQDNLAKRGISG